MRHKLRLEGVVTPDDMRRQYVYLPFQLPPGARRLAVNYHYDNQVTGAQETTAGNNIDVGIFDVRGADFLTGGFRGWSGGARSSFFVEPRAATPGYIRGPLQPGEWTLIFGCSKIEDPAVHYRVHIDVDLDVLSAPADDRAEVPTPGAPNERSLPGAADGRGRWYRGDLHAHSEHSDGANTVDEIVDYTRRVGLDYFALTDHNTVSHWDDLARLNTGDAPLLIAGEEITMYGGHANVWGLDGWIDFRGSDSDKVRRLVDEAHRRGSMFSINHPDSPIPWKHPSIRSYQAVEVWNAPWRWFNEPALLRWVAHLDAGERMVAVGGSDSHCVPPAKMTQPNGPGEPCSWVYVAGPLGERAVLDAVAAGHVFVSEDPTGPFIELRADADGDGIFETLPGDRIDAPAGRSVRFHITYRGPDGKHIRLFGRDGLVREVTPETEEHDSEFELRLEGDGYLRAEVRGFRGRPERGEVVHALTNPIYWGAW
ncbi:MAG: PHP domain-containing protein [Dehalococcoidia bacterium]|nr:PHP domain-containing protein [Dehalococcoidia bacterium]